MGVKERPCWEIIGCDNSECCVARNSIGDGRPCWEVASELNDYRSALNVCKDCLVYVSKEGISGLSEEELARIIAAKRDCVLARGECGCTAASS